MASLEETFREVNKDLRLWETWKLKYPSLSSGDKSTTWDRMSGSDQKFNLAWNELRAIVREGSVTKLRKILNYAKTL